MRHLLYRLFLIVWPVAGCRDSALSGIQAGHLEARWTGADTGEVSAPAIAEWCEENQALHVRAIRGDTGLALAVYPAGVLAADTYRVVAPGRADSTVPSARVAVRWFGSTSISGFQGDSGSVVLERTNSGALTGRVEARAKSVVNSDRLTVSAGFRDLTIVPESRGCTPEAAAVEEERDTEPLESDYVD